MGGVVGDWNLGFGRFDLAKQPAITGSGASPESLESDLIASAHCRAVFVACASCTECERRYNRQRDRACGLSLPAVEEWGGR